MKSFISIIFTCSIVVSYPLSISGQGLGKSIFNYDKCGNVKSVEFSASDKEYGYIKSAEVFFRDVLKAKANDSFVRNKSIYLGDGNETFDQYYKGIKVENAGYTFHYDENGFMRYAHGNYINVSDVDTNPTISKEDASIAFARFIGISPDSITLFSAELIIKKVKGDRTIDIPLLVYKVFIETSKACNADYGYVDAKTGNVVKTESSINAISAMGTFYTKYYGTKYATTNYNGVNYLLNDPTRGNGIETKDLQNHNVNQTNYASFLADYDNNWYYTDYADSTFMAFDVHWALQKIYDRLYNMHGKNSFDNNGKKIMAYVRALVPDDSGGYNSDNACWDNTKEALFFGEGDGYKRPVSSLDVVAHEYGHGISHYQVGWTHDEDFLNEGLSDIWGAIMDYRFGDTNAEVWRIGEHIPVYKTCMRDISYPSSISAECKMASTYNSSLYHFCDSIHEHYGMSGVFSHWFYLLVNGGYGTNANNTYYNLNPVGMDVAENLIVKAVYDNYLRYTTSYEDLRQAFVWAARSMNISGLEAAVCNAWYAVGVGDMYLSLTGPALICSQSIYSVNDLPNGFYVDWSLSDSYYNQNCLEQYYPAQCEITRSSNRDMVNATLTAAIKHNSNTIKTLTKSVYAYAGFKGYYTSGNLSGDIDYTHLFYVRPGISTNITSPNFIEATVSYDNIGTIPSYFYLDTTQWKLYFVMPTNNNGIPILINVNDVCGNTYQLYAMPLNSKNLNIFNGDNCITVMLNEDDDPERGLSLDQAWTVEIRNATTGTLMATQSSSSRSETISTAGWPNGIYVVKATIGNEVQTEKVMVR